MEPIAFPVQTTFFNRRLGRMVMVSTAHLDPPGYWGDRPYETMIFMLDDDGAKNGSPPSGLTLFPHYSPEAALDAHRRIARRARIREIPRDRLRKLRKQDRRTAEYRRRASLSTEGSL